MAGTNSNNIMRRVAGALYIVFFAAELYLLRPALGIYALTYGPVFLSLMLVVGAGCMAVYTLGGTGAVRKSFARGAAVATALVVLKTLLMYDIENTLLSENLSTLLPSLAGQNLWLYVFIILRLLLLVVAAFFLLNASAEDVATGMEQETVFELDVELDEAATEANTGAVVEADADAKPEE